MLHMLTTYFTILLPIPSGQETTANTLSFAVALICEHPEVHDRLVCEVDEVLGGKSSVCAEDLERLQYTEQVISDEGHIVVARWSVMKVILWWLGDQ